MTAPRVLGVLNLTPDSFSDGGVHRHLETAVARAWAIAEEGADALDVGGESTRPGSEAVPVAVEIDRVKPVLAALGADYPIPIAIDTRRAAVLDLACDLGATILNDTGALRDDPEIGDLAAARDVDVILMHRLGQPRQMQNAPSYQDVVAEVVAFFRERVDFAVSRGIDPARLVLDPGLGFGKRVQDNFVLAAHLEQLVVDGLPLLVGASRKSFTATHDARPASQRLPGSLAFVARAVEAGAAWVRVHDVADTVAFVGTYSEIQRSRCHDSRDHGVLRRKTGAAVALDSGEPA